jgi:hypothetical protein
MSLEEQTPEEAAEQALTKEGCSEVEITDRERVLVLGKPDIWMVSATARYQDGKRYEVRIPVVQIFGGLTGVINQVRKREID